MALGFKGWPRLDTRANASAIARASRERSQDRHVHASDSAWPNDGDLHRLNPPVASRRWPVSHRASSLHKSATRPADVMGFTQPSHRGLCDDPPLRLRIVSPSRGSSMPRWAIEAKSRASSAAFFTRWSSIFCRGKTGSSLRLSTGPSPPE